MIEDRVLEDVIAERYNSYTEGIGLDIVEGKTDFHKLEEYALQNNNIENQSGSQERLKGIVNQYLLETLSTVKA